MGIDAKMLVRYRGSRPTDEQLTRWSWDLCCAVGAKHFWTEDGLPPEVHHEVRTRWDADFVTHPSYPEFLQHKADARDKIIASIGEAPEMLRRAIELTNRRYPLDADEGTDVPATHRAPGRAWVQDGNPILAQNGEWFLKVSLASRYYAVGYERGDLLTICAAAEWCETNLTPCDVWYGGDSSGVLAEPFPDTARRALRAHMYSTEGREYFKHDPRSHLKLPKPCGLCVSGENRLSQYGFGGGYAALHCAGCGKNFESRDQGATWEVKSDGR